MVGMAMRASRSRHGLPGSATALWYRMLLKQPEAPRRHAFGESVPGERKNTALRHNTVHYMQRASRVGCLHAKLRCAKSAPSSHELPKCLEVTHDLIRGSAPQPNLLLQATSCLWTSRLSNPCSMAQVGTSSMDHPSSRRSRRTVWSSKAQLSSRRIAQSLSDRPPCVLQ